MFRNSYFRVTLFTLLLAAALGWTGGITTWSTGDTVTASGVNANFQHIHNSMVGGHGARLVNADVNASANISRTKIQSGLGIAMAWAEVPGVTACPATQTLGANQNVTSAICAATGVYSVTLTNALTDANYAAVVSSASTNAYCSAASSSSSVVTVACRDATGAAADSTFSLIVMDDN